MNRNLKRALVLLFAIILAPVVGAASDLEKRLQSEYVGAWGVLGVEVYSACSGTYSDNQIGASGAASHAGHAFETGELVKVDKLKVKRARVDLLVTLAEPKLVPRQDGPFTLYDERVCRAQLIFPVPREVVKTGDIAFIREHVERTLSTFPSQAAARASESWNGRQRAPYPADYDDTLARHAVWQATEINAAIDARVEQAGEDALRIVDRIVRDAEYLDGFAAGVEEMRSVSFGGCDGLADAVVSTYDRKPPSEKSDRWKDGFRDGQKLAFNVELVHRLDGCRVAVPPLP